MVEREDGILTFSNSGTFIPESVEHVINADAPESRYRNPFLANAMVNLNLIDTIGSGIKRMFNIQRKKYFPLPDYDVSNKKVQVSIIGKVLDVNSAKKLAQLPSLTLQEIILLDKVSKARKLTNEEAKTLHDVDGPARSCGVCDQCCSNSRALCRPPDTLLNPSVLRHRAGFNAPLPHAANLYYSR